ncbi:MAG TPA: Gfo/Idh/MocA family oxidoreductase [Phycisphaerae bacterium]|nr:Gfo/Idh/MocA family oxidoreductase [Phycisphaerae bacterium]HOJ74865.1 Gfo/Idh/MocA family oxidoreductase [Phycisphaerae bacterium]HOM52028.1 Gfo/Idh/MocA family oxidoreductase [Phycisphaerae bacterium]HON64926.1 Gfo/Idh/MocA family oxidoreductase [Phycisphaerae bacterium]HOQ86211.1 Gfo/Idh/MocA family oxidoreductase [Phycisphaerae bacterium]
MAKKYGMGIIGAGMIGNFHARAIKGLPNAELISVCEQVPERGQKFAAEHGCAFYDDLTKFLNDDRLDVVTVATPSGLHRDVAVAAAKAGKHCIVEKPIEITLPRIDAILEAHDKAGTTVGGIFNMRYEATTKLLKQAVDQGRFGRMTFGMAFGPWWRDQAYYDQGGWRGKWEIDGGGAMMNQGIHTIDLLQYFMGPVKQVCAFTRTLCHERIEVEDTSAVAVEFASGALGTMACTTSMWPGHYRVIEVAGDRGTVGMADAKFIFWQFAEETEEDNRIRAEYLDFPKVSVGAANPSAGMTPDLHRANFADFLAALDEKRQPSISGLEARKAVQIILAVYESARTGKPVALQ